MVIRIHPTNSVWPLWALGASFVLKVQHGYPREKYLASEQAAGSDFLALVPRNEPSGDRLILRYGEVSLELAASTLAGYGADLLHKLVGRC